MSPGAVAAAWPVFATLQRLAAPAVSRPHQAAAAAAVAVLKAGRPAVAAAAAAQDPPETRPPPAPLPASHRRAPQAAAGPAAAVEAAAAAAAAVAEVWQHRLQTAGAAAAAAEPGMTGRPACDTQQVRKFTVWSWFHRDPTPQQNAWSLQPHCQAGCICFESISCQFHGHDFQLCSSLHFRGHLDCPSSARVQGW